MKLYQKPHKYQIRKLLAFLFVILITDLTAQTENCDVDIVLQNQVIEISQSETYQASNTIGLAGNNTSFTVAGNQSFGGNLILKAGESIQFLPDFVVERGGVLNATIETCSPNTCNSLYDLQWGHHRPQGGIDNYNGINISANQLVTSDVEGAWNITQGASSVTIAVIDSGLDRTHDDIESNRIVMPFNFSNNNTDVNDFMGHGTHVTGIIAATSNNEGATGVDQHCRIMPLKIGNVDNIIQAIYYAVDNGADIINLSIGGISLNQNFKEKFDEAINYIIDNNVLFIAAT